jgi:hypothetical protein
MMHGVYNVKITRNKFAKRIVADALQLGSALGFTSADLGSLTDMYGFKCSLHFYARTPAA